MLQDDLKSIIAFIFFFIFLILACISDNLDVKKFTKPNSTDIDHDAYNQTKTNLQISYWTFLGLWGFTYVIGIFIDKKAKIFE